MLWGAMNNATQAMMATSWQMGSISQNISNLNTVGYKNKETLFKTMMSETKAAPNNGLNIFTVKTADRYHIQAQGVVTPTGNWSDLAINGRGFFMVAEPEVGGGPRQSIDTENPDDIMYTRSGIFHQEAAADGRNYFLTQSGQNLLGWQADADGNVTESGSPTAVYTEPETVIAGHPTATATIIANLPSQAAMGASAYSADTTVTNAFTGTDVTMTLDWARVDGNTWTVTPSFPNGEATTASTVTMDIDAWGNVTNLTPSPMDLDLTWTAGFFDPMGLPDETYTLPSLAGLSPSSPELQEINLPVYDSAANAQTMQLAFERVGANQWYLHVPDSTDEPILVEFDGDGQLVSPESVSLTSSYTDADTGVVTTAAVAVDISGLDQYTDTEVHIGVIDQDGYKAGQMRYARFNSKGELTATYDNGQTRTLFKLPVATFVSENNLDPVSGTLFKRSTAAGDLTVTSVENAAGGGGTISSEALENSTVAIEDEFTKMIMTQKAYSTNATVFKTADEMTTVVRDLK